MFRMLGADPVYQYDYGLDLNNGADPVQKVITLEPAYGCAGGDENWVEWFLKENFSGNCLSFGYAQAGQENSFGWPSMEKGINYQFKRFSELESEGKIECLTMSETGRYFKDSFYESPASVIYASGAYDDENKKSLWYSCKKYRINIYADKDSVRIRDMYLYSDEIGDIYENSVCEGNTCKYEALPVTDGNRFSGNGILAGIYPHINGKEYSFESAEYKEKNNETAQLIFEGKDGKLRFELNPDYIEVKSEEEFSLKIRKRDTGECPHESFKKDEIEFLYNGYRYSLYAEKGSVEKNEIISENCIIRMVFLDVKK